jgi:hypothetical protein
MGRMMMMMRRRRRRGEVEDNEVDDSGDDTDPDMTEGCGMYPYICALNCNMFLCAC